MSSARATLSFETPKLEQRNLYLTTTRNHLKEVFARGKFVYTLPVLSASGHPGYGDEKRPSSPICRSPRNGRPSRRRWGLANPPQLQANTTIIRTLSRPSHRTHTLVSVRLPLHRRYKMRTRTRTRTPITRSRNSETRLDGQSNFWQLPHVKENQYSCKEMLERRESRNWTAEWDHRFA